MCIRDRGCVLAPVIFNLFLVAITLAFRYEVTMEDAVGINYRLDGNLFNVRRLQAKTKPNSEHVFELQYADDAAQSYGGWSSSESERPIWPKNLRRLAMIVWVTGGGAGANYLVGDVGGEGNLQNVSNAPLIERIKTLAGLQRHIPHF